jgi:uncharacterized protein YjbI with pentapeptide repeats
MIEPKRAPVRPRGISFQNPHNSTPLLLDEEIRSFAQAGALGNIAILGRAGWGKTTALQHLAATLLPDFKIALLDEPPLSQLGDEPDRLVVYTTRSLRLGEPISEDGQENLALKMLRFLNNHLAMYVLEPWTQDDLIEYLLSVHHPRCASVMARVCAEDHLALGGVPELWRIALDRLACDDSLPDVRRALHRHLQEHLTDTDLLERARSACLNGLVTPGLSLVDAVKALAKPGFAESLIRVLRHPPMQRMLAAERIAADLHGEADCDYLAKRLPCDLVEAVGRLILMTQDNRALDHLHSLLAGPPWSHAMAVSILHAAGASANLRERAPTQLAGAYLEGVSWPSARLVSADLEECDLTRADLHASYLDGGKLRKCILRQALLSGASLDEVVADEANFSAADLTRAFAERAQFNYASFENADLSGGIFERCSFLGANLGRASFREANLSEAKFQGAEWEKADFSFANLTCADLGGRCLRNACWLGASFHRAGMDQCDLEYMTLPNADFCQASLCGALLTGSIMKGANFQGAYLQNAGLADIEWEEADLRGADLRGASFHMGSTRSGLVGSTIPCKGSKTGFYTDDYDEQSYKVPEEIRKANLCGADLRGAILDGVDFYLVDLRGAQFDEKYADHLRRCGAILEARV